MNEAEAEAEAGLGVDSIDVQNNFFFAFKCTLKKTTAAKGWEIY